jgi:predicted 3-demethylubiquinone-9 3-methyltransferase (glyoxalase superfamily)
MMRGFDMQKITPFLWFDGQAEEAANFYVSVFKNSKVTNIMRVGDAGPGPKGSALVVGFEIEGVTFSALNGGPNFKFNEAISFVVHCESQQEVDYYWSRLTEGGKEIQCGWLKDKFGVAWQIVPTAFFKLVADPDPAKVARVMAAMMKMVKFDIPTLEQAAKEK